MTRNGAFKILKFWLQARRRGRSRGLGLKESNGNLNFWVKGQGLWSLDVLGFGILDGSVIPVVSSRKPLYSMIVRPKA